MDDERDPDAGFDDALRTWAARPPHRPPTAAAREIRARIAARPAGAPRTVRGWAWAAAGALTVAVGLAGLLRFGGAGRAPEPGAPPAPSPAPQASPPLGDGEVLIWLDADTPLFMTFAPPPGGRFAGGAP